MNNRTTIMIALLTIAMMVVPASAISDSSWTDGNDKRVFVGEPVTIAWKSAYTTTYIVIEAAPGAAVVTDTVSFSDMDGGYIFESIWDTATLAAPNDTQTFDVYLNDTMSSNSSSSHAFQIAMNNLSVSITPNQAGVSALSGSNITVTLNTTGASGEAFRAGAGFTIETNVTAKNIVQPSMNSTTGNGTGIVTPMTVGDGFTITVYTNTSTKRVFTYNVSQLDVTALEVAADADDTNLTYVNVTNVTGANVNIDRDTNVTLTLDTTARPSDTLNDSGSDETRMNITILRGSNSTAGYGNITFPINASIGSTGGTGTITATTNTSTVSWSADYGVHPADEKITLIVDPASAYVGANISVSGWIANASATVCINITDASGVYVNNSTATVRTLDGHYTYTWNTNDTWNTYYHFPSFTSPATFTILANSSDAGTANQTTESVTLSNDLTVEPNVTEAYIDQVVNISATSTRLNGTLVTINITDSAGRCVYFNDTHNVTNDVENTIGNWTWYLNAINASNPTPDLPSPPDGNRSINKTDTYTITLNDTATKVTDTILLKDDLAVNAGTGVPGLNVTLTGTSSRADGNTINVSIVGPSLIYRKTVNGTTYDYDAANHTSKWNATWKAVLDGDTPLGEGDYTVTATDRIVTSSAATYTLGTAIITIDAPTSAMMDDIVWINGTSNLEEGTSMLINITSGTDPINVSTLNAMLQPDRTYSCAWTVNQSNASMYAAGFTQPSETYTINVSNVTDAGMVSKTAEIVVSDTLSLTNATGVPGDAITISGTSNRINGTQIEVVVTATNYINTSYGTVLSGEYNVTWYATSDGTQGGTNLPAGEYTVTANDTVVKVTGKATLSTADVSLTQPESGDSFMVGTPVEMVGTTNRQNGTIINFRITGPNYVNDTISAIANVAGDFNVTWDTAGCATGDYYITAKNGTDESTVVAVTLTPVLTVDTIVVDPAGPVSLPNVSDTQQFNATCKNGTTELTGITVTWNSDNTTVGTIDASGLFTAKANGTTNVTATAQDVTSNTVSVTVGAVCVKGELDGVPGITANDALIALRMSVGLETPDLCAADVVAPFGTVDATDALQILRASVGLVTL